MSGQGYEELKLLNRRIDELINNYNNLKVEYENLKTGNDALQAMLQEREAEIKELEKKYDRIKLTGALLGDGENGKLDLNIKIGNDLIQSAKLYNESLYITEDDEEWYIVEYDLIKLSELYHILAEKNPDIVDSINSGYFNLKNK